MRREVCESQRIVILVGGEKEDKCKRNEGVSLKQNVLRKNKQEIVTEIGAFQFNNCCLVCDRNPELKGIEKILVFLILFMFSIDTNANLF